MKLSQIATAVNARLENGSPDVEITGVNGIEQAEPGEITFVSNPKYAARARSTKASAVILAGDFSTIPAAMPHRPNASPALCPDPQLCSPHHRDPPSLHPHAAS